MIGIGGTGMSSLASLILANGWDVSGSDSAASEVTTKLHNEGAQITIGHSAENLPADCSIVACSAAIPADNPEMAAARAQSIPVLKYAQVLGIISSTKKTVAVAGTHGKTTTTAMVTSILRTAGLPASYVLGGQAPFLGQNLSEGGGEYFVVEACEYDRSFLNLKPSAAIITNVEPDHLDYYGTFDEVQKAFSQFADLLDNSGKLVVCADCRAAVEASSCCRAERLLCGFSTDDYRIADDTIVSGSHKFALQTPRGSVGPIHLRIPGIHNVRDAALATTLTLQLGVSPEAILSALEQFPGVNRRFQILTRKSAEITVIDDYAHHPSEILSVVFSCREMFPSSSLWVLFQPHQHSRTLALFDSFAEALLQADNAVVAPIYSVREGMKEQMSVSSQDLVSRVNELGGWAEHIGEQEKIVEFFSENLRPGDVLAVMGAGDIYKTAARIARSMEGRKELERATASNQM